MRTVDEMVALREMLPLKLSHYIWVNYVDIELTASIKGANRPPFLQSSYFGSRSSLEKVNEDYWNDHHKKGDFRQAGEHCAVVGQCNNSGCNKVAMHDWPCTGRAANKWSLICSIDEATLAEHIERLDDTN